MYYKIENNIIVEGPISLDSYKSSLTSNELIALGYFPIEISAYPEYDINTQYIIMNRIIDTDKVIHEWTVHNIPDDDIEDTIYKRKICMKQNATDNRYRVETSGLSINGIMIKTDRESQATIAGTLNFLGLVPSAVIDWKGAGGWTTITAQSANYSAIAIGMHVQACFSHERALCEAIDLATTHAELDSIDINSGWPPNIIEI